MLVCNTHLSMDALLSDCTLQLQRAVIHFFCYLKAENPLIFSQISAQYGIQCVLHQQSKFLHMGRQIWKELTKVLVMKHILDGRLKCQQIFWKKVEQIILNDCWVSFEDIKKKYSLFLVQHTRLFMMTWTLWRNVLTEYQKCW